MATMLPSCYAFNEASSRSHIMPNRNSSQSSLPSGGTQNMSGQVAPLSRHFDPCDPDRQSIYDLVQSQWKEGSVYQFSNAPSSPTGSIRKMVVGFGKKITRRASASAIFDSSVYQQTRQDSSFFQSKPPVPKHTSSSQVNSTLATKASSMSSSAGFSGPHQSASKMWNSLKRVSKVGCGGDSRLRITGECDVHSIWTPVSDVRHERLYSADVGHHQLGQKPSRQPKSILKKPSAAFVEHEELNDLQNLEDDGFSVDKDKEWHSPKLTELPMDWFDPKTPIRPIFHWQFGSLSQIDTVAQTARSIPPSPTRSDASSHQSIDSDTDSTYIGASSIITVTSHSTSNSQKQICFHNEVEVLETHSPETYNRRPPPDVTYMHLTPELKVSIRDELNHFKKFEMRVHRDSMVHTVFH